LRQRDLKGVTSRLIGMEVNHNNNKTLHAHDGNEEMRFLKN
jgi:hypothetical protein